MKKTLGKKEKIFVTLGLLAVLGMPVNCLVCLRRSFRSLVPPAV